MAVKITLPLCVNWGGVGGEGGRLGPSTREGALGVEGRELLVSWAPEKRSESHPFPRPQGHTLALWVTSVRRTPSTQTRWRSSQSSK